MTGKRFGPLAVIAAAMALVLAACGAEPTATPTLEPTATPLPEATPTPDAAALFQAEWSALIAAAQEEGELTATFGGGAGRKYRPIASFFGEKFGIEMIIATGSGGAHVNRILAEQETGRYLVDVMYGGPTSVNTRMIPAGALDPIAELFIHPEVTDQSLWYGGKHWYTDEAQKFQFSFAATAKPQNLSMRYNTNLVSEADIDALNSVFDYLDPKWKGKIVARLPIGGGSGGTYYTAYVHPEIGREWIDGFFSPELEVTFLSDVRLIVDSVAKGKFAMVVAGGGTGSDLDALGALGAPVGAINKEFKEGGDLSASGSTHNVTVPINRPHPNAAKLWVNWWLSQEGQTLMHTMSEDGADQTLREDVTDWGETDPNVRRMEGQSYYFFDTDPVYIAKRQEATEYVTAAYRATH